MSKQSFITQSNRFTAQKNNHLIKYFPSNTSTYCIDNKTNQINLDEMLQNNISKDKHLTNFVFNPIPNNITYKNNLNKLKNITPSESTETLTNFNHINKEQISNSELQIIKPLPILYQSNYINNNNNNRTKSTPNIKNNNIIENTEKLLSHKSRLKLTDNAIENSNSLLCSFGLTKDYGELNTNRKKQSLQDKIHISNFCSSENDNKIIKIV